MDPILSLFVVLIVAFVLGELIHFLRLPRVLGYILGGFLLSLAGSYIGFREPGQVIVFLKDLGIVFLFFFIGLGIDLASLSKKFRRSIKLGFWTALIPFIFGMIFSFILGFGLFPAFVVGICASISAQAVCVMVLDETNMLRRKLGQDIIGAGITADILQLIGISVLFGFLPAISNTPLYRLLLNWLILLGVIVLIKLLLLPVFSKILEKEIESRITFFLGGIILAASMGYVAELLGIGSIIGAMFAGVLIRYFFDRKIVNRLAHDFRLIGFGFLIPILFLWTGFESFTIGIAGGILIGIILAVLAVTGNIIGSAIALPKDTLKQKVLSGLGLATKGDVEIILAVVTLEAAVITANVFSMIIVMSVTTMLLAPILFYTAARKL